MNPKTVNALTTNGVTLLSINNSFFVRTVHEWNKLEDSIVSVTSIEAFRAFLSCD